MVGANKKSPNFQDLYPFEDYKAAHEAKCTFNCGLSPVCLSAPKEHYEVHKNILSDKEAHDANLNIRSLKLEYAIRVWMRAALISANSHSPLLYYWWLHYADNATSFREIKPSEGVTPEAMTEGFWKLLEEVANSGKIKVCEGYSCRNINEKYTSDPLIEFTVVLADIRNAYKDIDDVFTHNYNPTLRSFKWDEIKHLFTQLSLKQLSLIDTEKLHKHSEVDEMLICACRHLDIDGVRTAVRMGADVNALNKYGASALQLAIEYFTDDVLYRHTEYTKEELAKIKAENYSKCMEIVDYLLDMGADIDLFGVEGMQPLTCAYYAQSIEMVRHLLEKGANPNYNSYRCDDVRFHKAESHQCTILNCIDELLSEEYNDYEKAVEMLVREHGGRRWWWDYNSDRDIRIGKYYMYMAPDNERWLFFDNDGWGIGTELQVSVEDAEANKTVINIPFAEDLKKWKAEYFAHINLPDFDWDEWNSRGKELAEKVARILPPTAALHYPYGDSIIKNCRNGKYYLETLREKEPVGD